jgi:regulator of protease activity HflC (stomatin/prohibitin superfamily)
VRESVINAAEGDKQKVVKESEGRRQQQINEAEGEAEAILAIARATAEGIRQVAAAITIPGGHEAVRLRVAEQYVDTFGKLARETNTLILPANVADIASMISVAMSALDQQRPAVKLEAGS